MGFWEDVRFAARLLVKQILTFSRRSGASAPFLARYLIVSDFFLEKNRCFEFRKAEVFKAGFLLEPDIKFGGVKPKRTYVGFKYQEGFSDHLPVLLRVEFPNQ